MTSKVGRIWFGKVAYNLDIDTTMKELVDHPEHYRGKDDAYEAIKVIEAWKLGFHLGNAVKYIARCGKKDADLQELKKAQWYINREISNREKNE